MGALRGTIEKILVEQRYGWIKRPDSAKGVRFAFAELQGGFTPEIGQLVEYEAQYDRAKDLFTAVWVRPLPPGEANNAMSQGGTNAPGLVPGVIKRAIDDCLFDSFYGKDGYLKQELFFEAAEKAAKLFKDNKLTPVQFRQLYQGFLGVARRLRDGEIKFPEAREKFGAFYCERVVRQAKRTLLPGVVKDLIDHHHSLVLGDEKQMLGLFRYLTNILCYFGDKDKD